MLTCAWGVPPLIWTGFYALRSQLHGNYYPAALVLALSFIAWARISRLLQAPRLRIVDVVLLSMVLFASVLTHPLNAAFLMVGAAGLVVFEPAANRTRKLAVIVIILLATALTAFWPYFDPLALAGQGVARGKQTFNNYNFFFRPDFVADLIWPALFGLLALPDLLSNARDRMLPVFAAIVTGAYVLGGMAGISVSHRFLAYVVLALQLMLTRLIVDWLDRAPLPPEGRSSVGRIGLGAAFALAGVQLLLAVEQLWHPWARTHYPDPLHRVVEEVSRVSAKLPRNARLLGWDSAALVMPAFGVHVVAYPRPMVYSPTDAERQTDYRRFFSDHVTTAERRTIAARWKATHIAYLEDELPLAVQRELHAFGPAFSPAPGWRLIEVAPAPSG